MENDIFSTWGIIELRMAFYAGIVRHNRLTISHAVAQRWRAALPRAIEQEYARIDSGELPRRLTVKVVLGAEEEGNGDDEADATVRPSSSR